MLKTDTFWRLFGGLISTLQSLLKNDSLNLVKVSVILKLTIIIASNLYYLCSKTYTNYNL